MLIVPHFNFTRRYPQVVKVAPGGSGPVSRRGTIYCLLAEVVRFLILTSQHLRMSVHSAH